MGLRSWFIGENPTVETMCNSILYYLDVVGCNPKNKTIFAWIRWTSMTVYTTIFLVLISVHAFHLMKQGISFESVETYLNFFLLIQFIFKYFFYRYYGEDITKMFDTMKNNFWKSDIIPEQKEHYDRMNKNLNIIVNCYRLSYTVMNFIYTIEPLFYRNRSVRIPTWLPYEGFFDNTPHYQLTFLYETVAILSANFAMLHFEIMSLLMIGTAYLQIDMIKYRLRNLGRENNADTDEVIKSCVDHHNLVLWYLQKMVSTFSTTMLQQVSTYIMAICLPAYLFTSTRTVNVGFCICTIVNIQNFFLYCIGGQLIYDQCVSVADAIYNCHWWKTNDKRYKHSLVLIMLRSSEGFALSAGGILTFNLDNFIKAMKASFSILQFLWSTNALKLDK